MATEAQINANRENAKKSTGPSEAGKENSSRNHTTHGLSGGFKSSNFFLLDSEDGEEFGKLMDELEEEYAPQNATERIIVTNLLHHEWLRGRALRFQHGWFESNGAFPPPPEHLSLFIRYEAHHERAFYKALRELQNIRKQETNSKIGFERHKLKISAENRAIDSIRMRKQTFEWKKEDRELKKLRVQAASASGNTSDVSPGDPQKAA